MVFKTGALGREPRRLPVSSATWVQKREGVDGRRVSRGHSGVWVMLPTWLLFFFCFVFKIFYLMRTIWKIFTGFVIVLLLFYVLFFFFFGCETCGILTPRPGIESTPSTLEGEVLSTGPPGKSDYCYFSYLNFNYIYLEVDVWLGEISGLCTCRLWPRKPLRDS